MTVDWPEDSGNSPDVPRPPNTLTALNTAKNEILEPANCVLESPFFMNPLAGERGLEDSGEGGV